ncbi:hypothetical protein AB4Y72_13130 [Arthrobacter sp. YAF34]|uniref:hypothetical protein n=1 Tax=Arthrobacter sp. YAF34 TaxID=3233083 RepID=UPI003F91DA26
MVAGLVLQPFNEFLAAATAFELIAQHVPGGCRQPADAGGLRQLFFPGDPEKVRSQFLGTVLVTDSVGNVAVYPRGVLSVQINERLLFGSQHGASPEHRMTSS